MTRYAFQQALGAFFHADRRALQELLPAGLRPLEAHPAHGGLAVTALAFTESEVGASWARGIMDGEGAPGRAPPGRGPIRRPPGRCSPGGSRSPG